MVDALTCGVHHVGLAVLDLDAAERFFVDALGWAVAGGVPSYPAVFVSDGATMVTLWRVVDPEMANTFDRRQNVGLHHLALKVASHAALETAFDRISAYPGMTIEFAPEPMQKGSTTHHFICMIPGGVRLELAAAVAT